MICESILHVAIFAKGETQMNKSVFFLSILLMAGAVDAGESNPQVKAAKTAIKSLFEQLVGELETAMKAGGPEKAISVCNTKAPEIAKKINSESSIKISRVSLKNRNPDNAPNEWQRSILLKFESRKAAGEDVKQIDYSESLGKEFRYMKAIPTKIVCLKCHGSEIGPKVATKLDELYPKDKAVGYQQGDIRGAFYVTKPK
jgi:hypothetical protein